MNLYAKRLRVRSVFTIDSIENYDLIRELTSFGADLVVSSPEEVRCSVIQRIEEVCQAYLV